MTRRARWQTALFPLRKEAEKRPPIEEQMAASGIPTPETEWQFHPVRKWRFDYAWPDLFVAFEQEGGTFGRYIVIQAGHERRLGQSIPIAPGTAVRVGGGHSGSAIEDDIEKFNTAQAMGWIVIRATTRQIRDGLAIPWLMAALDLRKGRTHAARL